MPLHALRFIHVANALIDHQLRDLGSLTNEGRSIALSATVTSFERIVEACVEHEIDFLLLTGGTFDERDHSLKARLTLRDGFETLRDEGIQVFVVPGPHDPVSAWRALGELPDNVTVFDPSIDEPTAVMRDETVVATIQSCEQSILSPNSATNAANQARSNSLRIGVIPPAISTSATRHTVENWLSIFGVDFLAIGAEYGRLTATRGARIGHGPGPAVPQTKRHVGPLGCSLIDLTSAGQLSVRLIATSPIRRERFEVSLTDSTSWDQLVAEMHDNLKSIQQVETQSLIVVDWYLTGSGTLFDSLHQSESQHELFELLAANNDILEDKTVEYRLELMAPAPQVTVAEPTNPSAPAKVDRPITDRGAARTLFGKGFFRRLDESHAVVQSVLDQVRKEVSHDETPWLGRLETLAERIDDEAVAAKAKKLGTNWFIRVDSANE